MKIPAVPYTTRDIAEAAALLTCGQRLVGLQAAERHFLFCFSPRLASERVSRNYWSGALRVDPRAFALNLRSLKDRVHVGR